MSKILKFVDYQSDRSVEVETSSVSSPEVSEGDGINLPISASGQMGLDPIASVEAQAQAILNHARQQVESWKEHAKREGWETGYAETKQRVEAEMAEALTAAQSVAQTSLESREQFIKDSQREIGRLAVAIARKIISLELDARPEIITDIVAHVIESAGIQEACRIRVNPVDFDALSPHWEAIAALQHPDKSWDLVADKQIERGGCLIESGGGTIDARLETRLRQVEEGLKTLSD